MSHYPEFSKFCQFAESHDLVPVYRRLICDSLTPVSAFHKIDDGKSACLFESVIGGEKVGRYSFLTSQPFLQIEATRNHVRIVENGVETQIEVDNPIEELKRRVQQVRAAHFDELPPFISGAIGYFGYDVIRYSEHLPNAPQDDRQLPDMAFAFYDRMIVFDHVNKTLFVVVMAHIPQTLDSQPLDPQLLQKSFAATAERVDQLVAILESTDKKLSPADIDTKSELSLDYQSNFTEQEFCQAVEKCVQYIQAGDLFQVVISQRLELEIHCPDFEIYRTLRVVNPSPFMFYLRTANATLVGSSPEIMVRVMDNEITVRPLAGTRKRGANELEDNRLAAELLADPKERAEHVMLVDLGRNDVGRVAKFSSVELSDVMTIERYSHVMHITSNVTGELSEGLDAFDAMQACLPAGTVSGAPKIRAMQIIDEIEPHRRGPYAGAVGYIDFGGNMDTCITLRTMVIQGNRCYVQAGAGIVADSNPKAEYQETLSKARGLLTAIEITEKRSQ